MISLGYITCRPVPRWDWLFESICIQSGLIDLGQIIIIDFLAQPCDNWTQSDVDKRRDEVFKAADASGLYNYTEWHPPMPTVWAGPGRLPKENWWHVSTCRNTLFCYAKNDFVTSLDDRCVLMPTWMDAVREASQSKYVVCGTYEKRTGMTVENGRIKNGGIIVGKDGRYEHVNGQKFKCPGTWAYGCTFGLPLEWALQINGFETALDGLSMEDVIFGLHLENNGRPCYFDPRMQMIEDRSVEFLGPAMRRESKQRWHNDKDDKGHKALEVFGKRKTANVGFSLRELRQKILRGEPFPPATKPTHDWFDGQPIAEIV